MRQECYKKNEELPIDTVYHIKSVLMNVGGIEEDFRSYPENELDIEVKNDGTLVISDYYSSCSWAYLYPQQLEHIKEAIEIAIEMRDRNEKNI